MREVNTILGALAVAVKGFTATGRFSDRAPYGKPHRFSSRAKRFLRLWALIKSLERTLRHWCGFWGKGDRSLPSPVCLCKPDVLCNPYEWEHNADRVSDGDCYRASLFHLDVRFSAFHDCSPMYRM